MSYSQGGLGTYMSEQRKLRLAIKILEPDKMLSCDLLFHVIYPLFNKSAWRNGELCDYIK